MEIRRMVEEDRDTYLALAKEFYTSEAVLHQIPEEYFVKTFEEMIRSDVYVDGFLMENEEKEPMGYLLISKTFSQECGGLAIWVEEVSVLAKFQGQGIGSKVLAFVESYYPQWARIRLEVEKENTRAIDLYKRLGYEELAYYQMVKDRA